MNHENPMIPESASPTVETYGLNSDTFGSRGRTALGGVSNVNQAVAVVPSRIELYELEKARRDAIRKANSFIESIEQVARVLAKSGHTQIKASESIETFCFDGRNDQVLVPTSWFMPNMSYTDDQRQFAILHEFGHFADLREAVRHEDEYSKNKPQKTNAYIDNFDIMDKKAKSLAEGYLETHPEASLESVKKYYYDKLHDLYNVLDDIYVNKLVQAKVPYYGKNGGGQESIESLYDKLGFNKPDMSEFPLHAQLINSLLAEAMLGSKLGSVKVSPLVQSVLGKKLYGKTLKENIEERIAPGKHGELVDPGLRYYIIRQHIEPEYLKLLKLDIEANLETPESPAPNKSSGDSGGTGDNSDSNPPVFSNNHDYEKEDDEVRKIIDSIKEGIDWSQKTEAEKEKIEEQEKAKSLDEKNGIKDDERKIHDEAVARVRGPLSEMSKFWERLIGSSVNYTYKIRDRQKSGDINRDNLMENFVPLQKGDIDELRVYERKARVRETTNLAEKIEVTLLVDCSGSMSGKKTEAARQTAALLMYSLRSFNEKLGRTRRITRSNLYADTEVIAFGEDYDVVKPFSGRNGSKTDDVAIIKSISAIDGNRGGTDDADPLKYILSRLSVDEKRKIKQQKIRKIIFEITDGASQTPGLTTKILDQLASEGVIVVGFQVGDVDDGDRKKFETIWNSKANIHGKDASRKKGIRVEDDISALPRKLMDALSDQLRNLNR